MRLYTTTGATQVDDPQYGTFKAGKRGEFDFPDELSDRLHGFHTNKKPAWETDDERVKRVAEEELESVRDPATLLAAVKEMGSNQSVLVQALAQMLGLTPAPATAPADPVAVVAPEQPKTLEDTAPDLETLDADETPSEPTTTLSAAQKRAAAKKAAASQHA